MIHMAQSLQEAVLTVLGSDISIKGRQAVSGGDCNQAYALLLSDNSYLFMKENDLSGLSTFQSEAEGIDAIAKTKAIATPKMYAVGTEGKTSFLLIEHITTGTKSPHFWEDFGGAFANMHAYDTTGMVNGGNYGWNKDNTIGFRPQINKAHETWVSFYRDCRIMPQVRDAASSGYLSLQDQRDADHLMERLEDLLTEPKHPSLLHGDLWSGNFMVNAHGDAVLIDPAVYVGHPEADLAMTRLFGGFHESFYRAYEEVSPLQEGAFDRLDLYHLYQLLNHLNQFGTSYLSSVQRILRKYS